MSWFREKARGGFRRAGDMFAGMVMVGLVGAALAQGFALPDGTMLAGHLLASGNPPTLVGCTVVVGATDFSGSCTSSATSGSITFAKPFVAIPVCQVVDATVNAATTAYTVSITAITLSTITTANLLTWNCVGRQSG